MSMSNTRVNDMKEVVTRSSEHNDKVKKKNSIRTENSQLEQTSSDVASLNKISVESMLKIDAVVGLLLLRYGSSKKEHYQKELKQKNSKNKLNF